MRTVAELMVTDVITLSEQATLAEAHELVSKRQIRHLPVLNEKGQLTGILSQQTLLAVALNTADTVGLAKLAKVEARTKVKDVMEPVSYTGSEEMKLVDAARFFLDKKTSVLCILRGEEIVGVISAHDFVRLAINFLEND